MAHLNLGISDSVLDRLVVVLEKMAAGGDARESPPGVEELIKELKGSLRHAPRVSALPLADCLPPRGEDALPPLPGTEGQAIAALLGGRLAFPLILCGAKKGTALGVLETVLGPAAADAVVFEGNIDDTTAFNAALDAAVAEGKLVIFEDERIGLKLWLYEVKRRIERFRKAGARIVIISESAPAGMALGLAEGCVLVDLSRSHGEVALDARRIQESVGGSMPAETLGQLRKINDPEILRTLRELAAAHGGESPELVQAIIDLAIRGERSRRPAKRWAEPPVEWVAPEQYAVDLLNTDFPPVQVLAMMKRGIRRKGMRALLHGPSGTGKTEFAKWLAQELGVPLMQRRAGDLMHWRLGKFEQLIAGAFRGAAAEGALLMVDEVESLMMERTRNQGWSAGIEITNTFLTELDRYQGLFICCTNHIGFIDRAMMRRMTVKVGFGPLRARDRASALERCLGARAEGLTREAGQRLSRMEELSLGDIGNVARRLELMREDEEDMRVDIETLLDLLEAEVKARSTKTEGRIGFL